VIIGHGFRILWEAKMYQASFSDIEYGLRERTTKRLAA
jgi:hypothetical protein